MNLELVSRDKKIKQVVILNGWACPKILWAEFVQEFANLPVLILDMDYEHGLGSQQHLEFLSRQVDEQTLLIGWSLGGMIGISLLTELERNNRSVAEAWFLMSGPCFTNTRYAPNAMSDQVFERFSSSLEQTERMTKQFSSLICKGSSSIKADLKFVRWAFGQSELPNMRVLKEGLGLLNNLDLVSELHKIKLPLNFIFGEKDGLLDVSIARYMACNYPQHRCSILPELGHLPCGSQKDQVLALIRSNQHAPLYL